MPLSAFLLALVAAVLHAGWNVLLARSRDVLAATTVALALSVILFAPVAAATWDVDAAAVPWIAASALLEIVYFVLLTSAYSRSDLSLVYPVARGSAPVLVLTGAAIAGATVGLGQALGVLLVGGGILLVRGVGGAPDARGVVLALAIGAAIAGYTLVDKEGLQHAAPIPYIELVLIGPAFVYGAFVARTRGTAALRGEATPRLALVGLLLFATYVLVLLALREAPAASVSAVRETSVVIATVLAALTAHQRLRRDRLAGASLVALGVALVALAGS